MSLSRRGTASGRCDGAFSRPESLTLFNQRSFALLRIKLIDKILSYVKNLTFTVQRKTSTYQFQLTYFVHWRFNLGCSSLDVIKLLQKLSVLLP
jgi:hypothetical protein